MCVDVCWSTSTCILTTVKMNSEPKKTHRVLQKKQPSTGNHRDTLLTPATPNFNVVIGSAEHHQQKWLFFLKAAKHKIQKTTLNWGTGGGMTSLVWYFMGWLFFFEEPGIITYYVDVLYFCSYIRKAQHKESNKHAPFTSIEQNGLFLMEPWAHPTSDEPLTPLRFKRTNSTVRGLGSIGTRTPQSPWWISRGYWLIPSGYLT